MRDQIANTNFAKLMGYERIQIVDWIYGLFAAIIGGGANAVVGGVTINMIDPSHFNAQNFDFYKLTFAMFLANAVISMFMYLKQKPLPAMTRVTTVSETELQSGSQKAMVTQSIEETTLSGCSS